MTNPLKGQVEVQIGTETYPCRLTIDSLIKIETELGRGVLQIASQMAQADVRINDLSVVLNYALRGGGNDFNRRKIYQLIEGAGIVSASAAVASLLTDVLSDPNEKKKQDTEEAKPQTR